MHLVFIFVFEEAPLVFEWHSKFHPSASDVIGQTPLVELSRLVAHASLSERLFAKLEYLNHGYSKTRALARTEGLFTGFFSGAT